MANQQTFYQMGLLDFDDDIKPFKIDNSRQFEVICRLFHNVLIFWAYTYLNS